MRILSRISQLLALLLLIVNHASATPIFINEIHYDNTGTDTGEFFEVAGPSGTNLTGWSVVLYNGSNGTVYNTIDLSILGLIPDLQNGFGTLFYDLPSNSIQNGSPDGISLVNNLGFIVQFLSYEGSFTASNGPATVLTSTDIGVSEQFTTPIGNSLQLSGTGRDYEDFIWLDADAETPGDLNNQQNITPLISAVPEPATLTIFALGLMGLALRRFKK